MILNVVVFPREVGSFRASCVRSYPAKQRRVRDTLLDPQGPRLWTACCRTRPARYVLGPTSAKRLAVFRLFGLGAAGELRCGGGPLDPNLRDAVVLHLYNNILAALKLDLFTF